MTPNDKSPPAQSDCVSLDFDLNHAPEKVWRALTDPALLEQWLLPVLDLKLEAGATFTLTAQPQPGWDGRVLCQFTEIEANRKLSYTWVVGNLNTLVTFSLSPTATGTRLSILQTGFKPDQKKNLGGARYGWKMMSGKLLELLARLA